MIKKIGQKNIDFWKMRRKYVAMKLRDCCLMIGKKVQVNKIIIFFITL